MTEEQKKVAAEFANELLELGAINHLLHGAELYVNNPLQVIPKPGQPAVSRPHRPDLTSRPHLLTYT
eukprot:2950612-Ditylum_brightwellii.AAC.1